MKDIKNALAFYLPMLLSAAAVFAGGKLNDLQNYWNGTLYWKWRAFCRSDRRYQLRNGLELFAYCILFFILIIFLDCLNLWNS